VINVCRSYDISVPCLFFSTISKRNETKHNRSEAPSSAAWAAARLCQSRPETNRNLSARGAGQGQLPGRTSRSQLPPNSGPRLLWGTVSIGARLRSAGEEGGVQWIQQPVEAFCRRPPASCSAALPLWRQDGSAGLTDGPVWRQNYSWCHPISSRRHCIAVVGGAYECSTNTTTGTLLVASSVMSCLLPLVTFTTIRSARTAAKL